MTDKAKKYLIGMLVSIVATFLWIFVAVALTGGREVEEFTDLDGMIMTVFMIVEIATVIIELVFAVLFGKEQGNRFRQPVQQAEIKTNKQSEKHGNILLFVSWVAAFGIQLGGIVLGKDLSAQMQNLTGWLFVIACCLSVLLLLLSILLKKMYIDRWNGQKIAQMNQFVYRHRENAEKTAEEKLSFLKGWRFFTGAYTVFLGLLGVCIAMCSCIYCNNVSVAVPLCFAATMLISIPLTRIRFRPRRAEFDENKAYVSREAYPRLYALADRAAKAVGCSGEIRIGLLPDCNAGMAQIGQFYSVALGVTLLSVMSEEEIYCVLLHEFAHVAKQNGSEMKERDYHAWLQGDRASHFLSGITDLFVDYFDTVYSLQFGLYSYSAALLVESAADRAMLLDENPAAVASALLKLKFFELFEWEKGTRDEPSMYQSETPPKQLLESQVQRFRQAMENNAIRWKELVGVEIQSRSASHPTLKLRLEALGIRELAILPSEGDSDLTAECEKALAHVEGLILENLSPRYEEERQVYFLEPKAQVEAWEAAGKPVVAEEYSDIVWALRQLGRNEEALELCQRAIDTLSDIASSYGYFVRGCHRLHCYDEAGIADIYTAIERNSNFLQEGIETIGHFCCLTGNQNELDIYRRKAVSLAQSYADLYRQTEILEPKDRLSPETLPEGMLEQILTYIRSVDEGQIEKIYLVRKTITEDFFTSVFVIRFDLKADEEVCAEILHKVFCYLDTCSDWQFSLFDYQNVMRVPFYKVENSTVYTRH